MSFLLFRQLFDQESSTFTYILGDQQAGQALLIDSVREQFDRDCQILSELNLKPTYVLETHVHADHVTAANLYRERFSAERVLGPTGPDSAADKKIRDGENLRLGLVSLKAIHTPGHTNTCTSFYGHGMVFTGDCMLIRGCGRTDFQEGSSETLFESVHEKLFSLPDDTLVYPAHDYKGRSCSSIGEEKQHNPRLNLKKTKAEFCQIMRQLKLDRPKKIDEAVPLNLTGGSI